MILGNEGGGLLKKDCPTRVIREMVIVEKGTGVFFQLVDSFYISFTCTT